MTSLTVIEPEGGIIAHEIRENLVRRGAADVAVVSAQSPHNAGDGCDIFVVSAGWSPQEGKLPGQGYRCRILLLPAGFPSLVGAKSVVTYGMSPKSTLTLSSIGNRKCVLALQRELVTAFGSIVDRQELNISAHGGADDLLAVSGTLLLLGFLPD